MEVKSGYIQTEIGEIPNDWNLKLLKEISSMHGRIGWQGLKQSEFTDYPDDPFLITGMNFKDGEIRWREVYHIPEQRYNEAPQIQLRPDDVLVTKDGTIGKLLFVKEIPYPEKASLNSHLLVFRPLNMCYFPKFLYYQLSSKYFKNYVEIGKSGTTFFGLSQEAFGNYLLPIPQTLDEQRAIAAVLSDVDDLIGAINRLIAKKRDIKRAAMQELLTGKKRLPGFIGKWNDCFLADIGIFSKGKGLMKDDIVDDGVPCIRYGEIYTQYNDYTNQLYSHISPEVAKESQRIRKGDLLFTGSGETAEEIGKCITYLGEEEAYAGGDVIIFSPIENDSMFLSYLMNHTSIVDQKARMGQGEVIVHISARNLALVKLHLPPLQDEERAIAIVLCQLDADITALAARRDKTILLKQGMMQELLTGGKRLT